MGTSQLKILEAQGHRFDESLQSVAPKAGTVALMPYSTTHATPGLSFMLQDMPSRAGKWMVVGSIAQGMDVLQKLSLQKGYTHDRYRDRQRRLLDPVAIRDIRWFCLESSIN